MEMQKGISACSRIFPGKSLSFFFAVMTPILVYLFKKKVWFIP